MDFDASWCNNCEKLIPLPKQTQTKLPPPPPPPSPHRRPRQHVVKKHGLVAGTGRVKSNGLVKTSPPLPPLVTKQRNSSHTLPLYCSDKCRRAHALANPSTDSPSQEPQPAPVRTHTGSIAKLAKMLNFPPPPPPPPHYEEPEADIDGFATEYNSGIMMAGRLLESFRQPPRKPQTGRYPDPPPERKIIPGWNDGSNAWRDTLYSVSSHKPSDVEKYKDQVSAYVTCNPSYTNTTRQRRSPAPVAPPPPQPSAEELLARYNDPLTRRSESRMSLYASPASPTSTNLSSSPTRERSIVPKSAEGKLLVRDVKLKARTGSSASLSSASASSRKSPRSPLSLASNNSEDPFPGKRPVFETRSWSYDNVDTYPAMDIPVKKYIKRETRIIDGVPQEVEVEVVEKPKCLFIFAPTVRLSR